MHRLLFPFVFFGNIAAVWFVGMVLFVMGFYFAFAAIIARSVGWGIRRRLFVFIVCWLCHEDITGRGRELFMLSESELQDFRIYRMKKMVIQFHSPND